MARFASLALSVLLLVVSAAFAQQPANPSARLESVKVTGSSHYTSQQIAPWTGLKASSMVTRDDLQHGADNLVALGPFATVQYKFSSSPTGVSVEYAVTDAAEVPAEFDNFIWMTDSDLGAAVTQSGILFDGQVPSRGTLLDSMDSALEKILDARGVHAQVAHELVQNPNGTGQMQQFHVEGLNLTVAKVDFSDPFGGSSPQIQQSLSDLVGKPYSRLRLDLFEQEQVLPPYQSHSYLQASCGAPTVRFNSSDPSAPTQITVVINMKPGPAYKWSGVIWQGNSVMPSNLLDALVKLKSGDLADGLKLQGLWLSVQDLYGRHGFLDSTVTPTPKFDANSGTVSYAVSIKEGSQYHMGKLVLSGLSVEGERRIRGAFPVPEGNVFDESAYDDFLSTGIEKAFAGLPVHYDKIGRFLDKHSDTAQVDVLIDFQ
jgi:outer membrane protein insertion porin family